MNALDNLLAVPEVAAEWPEPWRRLTTGDELFRSVCEVVRNKSLCDWKRLQDTAFSWEREYLNYLPEPKRTSEMTKWDVVRRLLWCAEQAATDADFYRTEVDRVCFALADTPEFIEHDKKWAWGCIRTFLDVPIRGRPVHVPVALVDESKGTGFLTTLVLEVLDGSAGEIFHHPADAFMTYFDQEFGDSMHNAWMAAKKLAQKEGSNVLCDGRWRLLREGQPIPKVKGPSASGAAAWGWQFVITGKVPDTGVIVVAQVDEHDVTQLKGVDGVSAKVEAIAKDESFNTIVVASKDNEEAAVGALLAGRRVDIKVKGPDEKEPWWKVYVPLENGREIKVVNFDDRHA